MILISFVVSFLVDVVKTRCVHFPTNPPTLLFILISNLLFTVNLALMCCVGCERPAIIGFTAIGIIWLEVNWFCYNIQYISVVFVEASVVIYILCLYVQLNTWRAAWLYTNILFVIPTGHETIICTYLILIQIFCRPPLSVEMDIMVWILDNKNMYVFGCYRIPVNKSFAGNCSFYCLLFHLLSHLELMFTC